MNRTDGWLRLWVLGGVLSAAAMLPAASVLAGKPGGGGGTIDTGTVYFNVTGAGTDTVYSMNPDGSGKTALHSTATIVGGSGFVPSRALHGGHRWSIERRVIAGETYPGTSSPRKELFAVRNDGVVVTRLTADPDLAVLPARWSPGDALISWGARRWSGGVAGPSQVYVAPVVFDDNGDVAGLAFQPSTATVTMPGSSAEDHDWSPDGTKLVVQALGAQLWIADVATGIATPVQRTSKGKTETILGVAPAWSPNGSRIAFHYGGEIRTVAPDGSGLATIVSSGGGATPSAGTVWSPNGTNLVFWRGGSSNPPYARHDICRVAATGGAVTYLTSDLDTRPTGSGGIGDVYPQGWR